MIFRRIFVEFSLFYLFPFAFFQERRSFLGSTPQKIRITLSPFIFRLSTLDFLVTLISIPQGSISQTGRTGIILFVQNPKNQTP